MTLETQTHNPRDFLKVEDYMVEDEQAMGAIFLTRTIINTFACHSIFKKRTRTETTLSKRANDFARLIELFEPTGQVIMTVKANNLQYPVPIFTAGIVEGTQVLIQGIIVPPDFINLFASDPEGQTAALIKAMVAATNYSDGRAFSPKRQKMATIKCLEIFEKVCGELKDRDTDFANLIIGRNIANLQTQFFQFTMFD